MTEELLEVPSQAPPSAAELIDDVPTQVLDQAPMTPVPLAVELAIDVTCPSCGRAARIDAGRRDAQDFCATCDFPLFWAVERVPLPGGDAAGDSGLRRLPGTVGRAALAALSCPACTEPNAPSAVLCVRCGSELRPRAVVAAPEPEPVPEPVAVAEPAPFPWWIVVLGMTVLTVLVAAVAVLVYT